MSAKQSRIIWIFLLLLAGFCVYLVMPKSSTGGKARNAEQTVNVKTSKVVTNQLSRQIDALGNALSYDSARLVASSSDYLVELNVKEGQTVQQGQLIARFNDTEEAARLAELKILLAEQSRQLARLKNLTKSQSTAQSLYDEQKAKVDATQAQIAALQAKISELTVRAPFAGVLGLRKVSQGAYLTTGTEITTVDDISRIRVEFSVAEQYLADIKTGMKVKGLSDAYRNDTFTGTVTAIDPRIDQVTRTVRVHAVIDNQQLKLRPGMLLKIQVTLADAEVLEIPEKAILPLQSRHFVFVVGGDNKVKQVAIQPGQRRPGFVEVVSGLNAGDEIVIEGAQKLRTGVLIERTEH